MKKLLVLLVLLAPIGVQANEVRVGILLHDIAHWWGYTKIEKGVDLNAEIMVGEGLVRFASGFGINTYMETSTLFSVLVLHVVRGRKFLSVGLGGAFQLNSVRDLGSPLLFRLSLEIGYKRFSILYCHVSNGKAIFGWNIPNAGLDRIGIRIRL